MVRDDHALGWSALVAEWWRLHQTCLVSIDNLHEIIVRNAELEVTFSGTLGQGQNPSQKRKLGEELRRVEGRVFGSWRVEIVVDCTVRGYPLYQLLPLAPRRPSGYDSLHSVRAALRWFIFGASHSPALMQSQRRSLASMLTRAVSSASAQRRLSWAHSRWTRARDKGP